MQKTLNITALILFFSCHIVAQNKEKTELKVKYGKVSDEEIAMKQYDKEPDAAAVYLFDTISLYRPLNAMLGSKFSKKKPMI
jgi:hypothetical protein